MWKPIPDVLSKGPLSPGGSQKILIADDDAGVTDQIVKVLGKAGYDCRVARSGQACLNELRKDPYHLLLAEILIPEIDGYDLCRHIRNDPLLFSLPVIFLTIMKDKNEVLKSFELGVDDYIAKPFQTSDLLCRVKGALIRATRHLDLHPVTRLPGQNVLLKKLAFLLEEKELFSCYAVRLPAFQSFVAQQGPAAGDWTLRMIAEILRDVMIESEAQIQFIAHLDDQSLVLITDSRFDKAMSAEIAGRFSKKLGLLSLSAPALAPEIAPVSFDALPAVHYRLILDELLAAGARQPGASLPA